jgi:hypothetical protein
LVLGMPIERPNEASRTEVQLKNDGEGFRLDKLYFQGRTDGYDFE